MSLHYLNLFAISGLLIAIAYFCLFVFIVLRKRTRFAVLFALHILAVFVWGIGSFLIGITRDAVLVESIWKVAYIGVLFIPVFLQHAVLLLIDKRYTVYLWLVYAQALTFSYFVLNGAMFPSFHLIFDGFYYHVDTPVYWASFVVWMIVVSVAHTQIYFYLNAVGPEKKLQASYILFNFLGFVGGTQNFLLNYSPIYPYGNFLVAIGIFFIAYTILKHQFLDIHVIIKKSLVYSVLIAVTFLLFTLVVVYAERTLQSRFGYSSIGVSVLAALIIGMMIIPLRNRLQEVIDRFLFKASGSEIVDQNALLREEVAKTDQYKSLATLASGMAHEIKNPLQAIVTFSEFLPHKMDDRQFLAHFSQLVKGEAERINDLVHQLMDYGKPKDAQLCARDMAIILDQSLDVMTHRCLEHKITVQRLYQGSEWPEVLVDDTQMRQVLMNLLINAIDAMPNGGELIVDVRLSAKHMDIMIRDTGCGMSKEVLKQIFTPFYTSGKANGTGLGLAICQGIIEQHNGKLTVHSKLGEGTTVTIKLPKAEQGS